MLILAYFDTIIFLFPPSGPCKNGIEAYPSYMPNSDYYTRLCTTRHDLQVISGSVASDEALEQTAILIDSIMDYVDPRSDVILMRRMLQRGTWKFPMILL